MADDVTLNSMSGGAVVATDDSGTGHVQLVKLAYSADGSRTHVDADTDGLKVKVSNATVTVALGSALPAGSNVIGGVTQSGTWDIGSITTLPALPAGSNVIGAVTQSGSWNVGITGTPTVTVGNASIPVTDNGGSLTVDGTVAATQSGSWDIGSITTLPSLTAGSATIGSIASIGTSVTPGTGAANLGKSEDSAHADGDTGVAVWGVRNDAASVLTSASGDYSPIAVDSRGRVQVVDGGASLTVDGQVTVSGLADPTVKVRPHESQTVSTYRRISTSGTNSALVLSNSMGYQIRIHGYYISNTNSSVRYVKLYDVSSAPTVGSSTPLITIAVPGNGAANAGFPFGPTFTTGLGIGMTTGASDSDTGSVAASEIIVNLFYEQLT